MNVLLKKCFFLAWSSLEKNIGEHKKIIPDILGKENIDLWNKILFLCVSALLQNWGFSDFTLLENVFKKSKFPIFVQTNYMTVFICTFGQNFYFRLGQIGDILIVIKWGENFDI